MGFIKRILLRRLLPFITSNLGIIKRAILKKLLPFLAANTVLDIDTLERVGGYDLRIRVECMGYKLVDHKIPLSGGLIDEVISFGGVVLDVDTVAKPDGSYLRIRVEVLGRKILDRYIPIVEFEDEYKPVDVLDIPAEMRSQLQPGANKILGDGIPFN